MTVEENYLVCIRELSYCHGKSAEQLLLVAYDILQTIIQLIFLHCLSRLTLILYTQCLLLQGLCHFRVYGREIYVAW